MGDSLQRRETPCHQRDVPDRQCVVTGEFLMIREEPVAAMGLLRSKIDSVELLRWLRMAPFARIRHGSLEG